MQSRTAHVLKSGEVECGGSVKLTGAAAETTGPASHPASAIQQAQIVENTEQYALIEVVCSCGAKTYVRCEYDKAPIDQPQVVAAETAQD